MESFSKTDFIYNLKKADHSLLTGRMAWEELACKMSLDVKVAKADTEWSGGMTEWQPWIWDWLQFLIPHIGQVPRQALHSGGSQVSILLKHQIQNLPPLTDAAVPCWGMLHWPVPPQPPQQVTGPKMMNLKTSSMSPGTGKVNSCTSYRLL